MLVPESFPTLSSLRESWTEQERNLRAFFEIVDDAGMQKVIAYRSLAGVESASPLWQMLQHVVNHATYHRGQLTTLLRQLGAAPPKSTDMIVFYREQS
jgi:uncharacterized damage-inducible protein DinB